MELLLNMTIGGTATACLILLVKGLLKSKLTPKWHFYIWIILALRLLVPGLPESGFSLMNAVPAAQNVTAVQNLPPGHTTVAGVESTGFVQGNVVVKSPVTGIEQRRAFSVPERRVNLLFAGWLAGTVLMASYFAGVYWIFSRRIRKLPECKDAEILELFAKCRREAAVTSDRISLRSGGNAPMLQGLISPVILIPEGYSREELRHVLIHELCHYRHRDILINIICTAFLCVYWFNPVFWLCFFTIRRDVEFLCDERVIEITGERKEYSRTLLKTVLRENHFLVATTSMQNGEKEMTKRIKRIAYFKKPRLWVSALAVLAVLIAGAVCLTDAPFRDTVNMEVGDGYYIKVPASWIGSVAGELQFINEKGESFGGAYCSQADLGKDKQDRFETASLPLPNHSLVLERKVIKGGENTLILVNLDMDSETAAQIEARRAAGDDGPSKKTNQNYIFILPDRTKDEVFTIWADSDQATEGELIRAARTLQKVLSPQLYQPETAFRADWAETANELLDDYFRNYVGADLPVSSALSGYRIDGMEPYSDQEASWSVIYPGAAVFRVSYTLDVSYPAYYSFAGGGFEIGSGSKTKIYKDQLAVFRKDSLGNAKFMGFVWPQDISEMGEAKAILHTINYEDKAQSPEALLKLKLRYIGNAPGVGRIIGSLPLAGYGAGMELHTKAEPYGLTVNYDLTALGDKVFESRPDRAPTDSSGWEPNPYIKAQLAKNSAILLSLIDNCSTVEFRVTGMSEFGVPYTYYYLRDREALQKELSKDPRSFAAGPEAFTGFLNLLETQQMSGQGV